MNLIKLTLFFCLFTTILCGQQEYPGYVVLLQGDTLRGRVVIGKEKIKFRQDGFKAKYLKTQLNDYGYYGNKVFFSKPDEIRPEPKSETKASIVVVTGDTLQDFRVYSIHPDYIIGYFEYPKYILYEANKEELLELIIHEEEGDIAMDLIRIEDYPKEDDLHFIYAERIYSKGLSAYNIDSNRPYEINYRATVFVPLSEAVVPLALAETLVSFAILAVLEYEKSNNWIIYKNERIYYINSLREWSKAFDYIFAGDLGFSSYLEKNNVSRLKIEKVLLAYNDFLERTN